ncbi:hypothetical protein AVEN_147588-1 [Araneus ventricosus]|uniref:Uncharacterized protein n=1 Tax=Araneus ventricosus TaxID=182803 RepID=A0A4Y2H6S2_ARAVE|nr:hypothetical protein AVEN_147588-1 [Araneus ventricosus]
MFKVLQPLPKLVLISCKTACQKSVDGQFYDLYGNVYVRKSHYTHHSTDVYASLLLAKHAPRHPKKIEFQIRSILLLPRSPSTIVSATIRQVLFSLTCTQIPLKNNHVLQFGAATNAESKGRNFVSFLRVSEGETIDQSNQKRALFPKAETNEVNAYSLLCRIGL